MQVVNKEHSGANICLAEDGAERTGWYGGSIGDSVEEGGKGGRGDSEDRGKVNNRCYSIRV